MKRIKCKACAGIWMVQDENLGNQKVCPYCVASIQGKIEFSEYDSLDKAIYGAVSKMGKDILQNPKQLSGFMMDMAPGLKKEIRIFSKVVDEKYVGYIKDAFNQETGAAEATMKKLRHFLVEEEGLSESWADILCNGIYGAIRYTKGIRTNVIINAEVDDLNLEQNGISDNNSENKQTGTEDSGLKDAEKYRKAAEQGDAEAQCNLGNCYCWAYGVKKDSKQAVKWYRRAAEQGNAEAQYRLGYCYYSGFGVEQNKARAMEWYQKSAKQGNVEAQYELGNCYYYGNGVKKDIKQAVKWYRQLAEQGNAKVQCKLGDCYYADKDGEQAEEWYRKAAEQGNAEAQYGLGNCYYYGQGVDEDMEQAVEWYRKSAEQGNAKAQYELGHCYYNGYGVPKDIDQAIKWYEKVAKQGDSEAQRRLGWCYLKGDGVSKNVEKAREWYNKALAQGNVNARHDLKTYYMLFKQDT